jgi:hypothetical protein
MTEYGDPKSQDTNAGAGMEHMLNINTIQQPADTPELNTQDNSLWKLIESHLEALVKEWEAAHPTQDWEEDFDEFKERARQTAFALTEDEVRLSMGHTRTILQRLRDAQGWYIRG